MSLLSANLAVKPRAFYKPDRTRRDPPFLLRRGHHLPPSPSLFLYSQFLSHPPFLFPRFSYLLLYLCGLSLSLFYSVSPRSPVLSSSSALRSSFIVHSWCTRTARVPRTRGRSTIHYRTWSIRARRSSSSSSSSLLPACRRGVVADQRPPGVPTCSVRTRSRGRMHTQPYSRWRWCSATSATTKVRDLSLLAVTWLRYSLLLDRGRFTFPREGICSSSLKFDELAQLAYRATV